MPFASLLGSLYDHWLQALPLSSAKDLAQVIKPFSGLLALEKIIKRKKIALLQSSISVKEGFGTVPSYSSVSHCKQLVLLWLLGWFLNARVPMIFPCFPVKPGEMAKMA